MDPEEVLERQRRRVKHRYYRTIDGISKARALVQSLTQQHHTLLATHTHKRLEDESDPQQHAMHKYIQASALAEQLRSEKQHLTELLEQRERLQIRLTTLVDDYHEDTTTDTSALVGFVVPPVSFQLLTEEDCAGIVRWSYASIQRFLQNPSFESMNASVLGWRDRRRLNGNVVEMTLEKLVTGFTALELALETWKLLMGKIDFTQLFSPLLGATMQCVQVVNDTNIVIYDHFADVGGQGSFQALFLASLVKIDDGYATLFQSVDRSRFIFKDEPPTGCKWLDLHLCYLFKEHEGHERELNVILGGKLEGTSPPMIHAWMLELLLTSMRWETRVIGARTLVWTD